MCGICGIISLDEGTAISGDILVSMRDTMIHRGPDDAGIYISDDKRVGLGHRRLSIIDLSSKGHQPMSNEDGSVWIVFNGEIYNYKGLRQILEEKGHLFRSDTDTEVIIHLYEEKGIDCISELEGMFAFGLWDSRANKLFIVRDRIGIKPLYYIVVNNKFIFASEIKAILQDPDVPRRVNEEALYHYLSFLVTPAPDTLFEGIKKLPNGCLMEVDIDGSISERRYWDPLDNLTDLTNLSEEEIARHILDELERAVNYRKVSDVPVGIFLSGGIDSTINAVLFSQGEKSQVKTFSIGYCGNFDSYPNEFKYAKMAADFINSDHHELSLTHENFLNFLEKLIYHQDEPIADPVCVPVYYVSKLARDNGVIVCQVGEGSDELFCGYPWWKKVISFEKKYRNAPRLFKKALLLFLKGIRKDRTLFYEWITRNIRGQPVFWGGAEAFTEREKNEILSQRLREKFNSYTSYEVIRAIRERFEGKYRDSGEVLPWMTYLDLNLRLPELLLMRVDKMSMAVSLEARLPFLDHKLVEFAMSIPESVRIKNGELKYILKRAVKDILPHKILNRKKQGFGVPVYEWFSRELRDVVEKELMDFCDRTDILDKNAVTALIENNESQKLWVLLNLALWWKKYIYEDIKDSR